MTNIADAVKANRTKIIKTVVIAGAVAATVIVVGALYKANVDAKEILELAEPAAS